MRQTVYIETTVISYLTAHDSRNVIRLADQMITRDWWNTQRSRFDLFTSELVFLEAAAGDSAAARERLEILKTLRLAQSGDGAEALAKQLLTAAALPIKAARDALHVAIAATNGIDYLLTWNCTHLANASMQDRIIQTCLGFGVRPPQIITPHPLFDEAYYERRNRPD